MSDVSSLKDTIAPKSDQLNAEQLLSGAITITLTNVKRGNDEQPVVLNYEGDGGRPYKPCKSMRKVLIFAWGDDGRAWIGKSMTLYNNPDVKFGGVKVGGIRISHLSHIERDIALSLTATKGRKEEYVIKKLEPWLPPHIKALNEAASLESLQAAYTAALKVCKARGTEADKQQIVAAKDQRKAVLQQPAGTVDEETGEVI